MRPATGSSKEVGLYSFQALKNNRLAPMAARPAKKHARMGPEKVAIQLQLVVAMYPDSFAMMQELERWEKDDIMVAARARPDISAEEVSYTGADGKKKNVDKKVLMPRLAESVMLQAEGVTTTAGDAVLLRLLVTFMSSIYMNTLPGDMEKYKEVYDKFGTDGLKSVAGLLKLPSCVTLFASKLVGPSGCQCCGCNPGEGSRGKVVDLCPQRSRQFRSTRCCSVFWTSSGTCKNGADSQKQQRHPYLRRYSPALRVR